MRLCEGPEPARQRGRIGPAAPAEWWGGGAWQMLAIPGMDGRFHDTAATGTVPVHEAEAMGTNRAFLGRHDGEGTSTKAHVQSLVMPKRFQKRPDGLPAAGPMGTNKAFLNQADGAGQSTKARTTQLDDLSGEFDPIQDADSNYGRVLGLAHVSRTNGVVPEDMDMSPEEKAPTQVPSPRTYRLAVPREALVAKSGASLG